MRRKLNHSSDFKTCYTRIEKEERKKEKSRTLEKQKQMVSLKHRSE